MITTKQKALLIAAALSVSTQTIAAEYSLNDNYNIRQKAMGGASVASFQSIATFYQNPAMLSLGDKSAFSAPKLEIGFNKNMFDKLEDLQNLNDIENESDQIQALKDLVPFEFGGTARVNPYFSIVKAGFGATAFSEIELSGALERKSAPQLNINLNHETTLMLGYGRSFDLFKAPLHVGIAPKIIMKNTAYDKDTGEDGYTLTQAEIINSVNNDSDIDIDTYSLSGYGVDLGFLRPLKTGYYGLSIKNLSSSLSGSKTIASSNVNVNASLDPLWTLGTSFEYKLPLIGKTQLAADYNIVSNSDNFYKNLHFGLEKSFKNFLFLRGGINQGFIVGGCAINLRYVKFDYAYFVEELGQKLGTDPLSTHNLQLSFTF
jgi:hypothetical protein